MTGIQRLLHRAVTEFGEHVVTGQRRGARGTELPLHELAELRQSHAPTLGHGGGTRRVTVAQRQVRDALGTVDGGPPRRPGRPDRAGGSLVDMDYSGDPTGFSSPLGQLVVLMMLLTSLTLLLRWWWQNRGR